MGLKRANELDKRSGIGPEDSTQRQGAGHTPGPWRVRTNGNVWVGVETLKFDDPEYGAADHSVGRDRWAVCSCNGTKATANARLIAAAPTMFEALKRIADQTCDHGPQEFCPREIARAAIAKAEGR